MPTDLIPFLTVIAVLVHDPAGNDVWIASHEIVSLRDVQGSEHLAEGSKCLINTLDGKYLTVVEDCRAILREIGDATKGQP